jgi:two-component system, chemotaxis family, sensor kinase Cph1
MQGIEVMVEFFARLFDTSDFPARWHCGLWTQGHGWLHIFSDLAVFGAYTAIPIVIVYFAWRRRHEIPFLNVFWLFGLFIFACGTTHLIEATIFYWPAYRLSGTMKLVTAVASWGTVLALIRVVPVALKYPGLQRMNEELRRTNRELDEFAYIVSHDLKAPLRGISSLTTWIEEDLKDAQGETRENLHLLMNRTQRMERLIEGILRYTRAGRENVHLEPLNTEQVLQEVIASLPDHPGIEIRIEGELPPVRYDSTMLQQVFQNLISNSLKYMGKPEGQITVSGKDAGSEWQFSVADTGVGIDPEHHERIFRIFQSLQARDELESTGLGLAIVKKIVETFGGRVWLESKPGAGTTFFFTVPKQQTIAQSEPLRTSESPA